MAPRKTSPANTLRNRRTKHPDAGQHSITTVERDGNKERAVKRARQAQEVNRLKSEATQSQTNYNTMTTHLLQQRDETITAQENEIKDLQNTISDLEAQVLQLQERVKHEEEKFKREQEKLKQDLEAQRGELGVIKHKVQHLLDAESVMDDAKHGVDDAKRVLAEALQGGSD